MIKTDNKLVTISRNASYMGGNVKSKSLCNNLSRITLVGIVSSAITLGDRHQLKCMVPKINQSVEVIY
jgi:hypothetical protein